MTDRPAWYQHIDGTAPAIAAPAATTSRLGRAAEIRATPAVLTVVTPVFTEYSGPTSPRVPRVLRLACALAGLQSVVMGLSAAALLSSGSLVPGLCVAGTALALVFGGIAVARGHSGGGSLHMPGEFAVVAMAVCALSAMRPSLAMFGVGLSAVAAGWVSACLAAPATKAYLARPQIAGPAVAR